MSPIGAGDLTDDLAARFATTLPRWVVEAEVAVAERELRGQIPDGALAELLHRLVDVRLRQRTAHPRTGG